MVYTIDAGHGGTDRKNRGPTGFVEADGNLKVALYLGNFLKALGATVYFTRTEDQTLSLLQRGKMAVANKSDVAISEHSNAFDGKAGGALVLYSVDQPENKVLGEKLSLAVSKTLNINNKGVWARVDPNDVSEDYYGFIDYCQDHGIPKVFIMENAFHDNPKEEKILKVTFNLITVAIAQGLVFAQEFGHELKGNYEEILATQQGLRRQGYSVPLSGKYDVPTCASIMDFQEKKKLLLTGLVSRDLLVHLDSKLDVIPQWKQDGYKYLRLTDLLSSDHSPLEELDFGELGVILQRFEERMVKMFK